MAIVQILETWVVGTCIAIIELVIPSSLVHVLDYIDEA